MAKTLAINTLSKAVQGSFSRVQFTPDLLPADVVGTMIYNTKVNDFSIKKGPIFANFVLLPYWESRKPDNPKYCALDAPGDILEQENQRAV